MVFLWTNLCFALFAQVSWQQKDPLNDFCRRFGQQSTVIDRRLFLDGGMVNWNPMTTNPGNFSNTWLLYEDLDVPNEGMPQIHANLTKNGSIPSVSGGILWADTLNRRFFLYGGDYYQTPPDSYNLLSYDAIYDKWDSFGPPNTQVQRTSWGAGCATSERGEGYYYGGWQSNTTMQGWGTDPPAALSSFVKYNMDANLWTSYSGPDSVPRAEGVMVFIPASDGGMLIYFGGIATPYGNNTMVGMPMDTIMIYDIAGSKWYNQTATGNVPDMRRRFCAGATWAEDQSSYNIYLYGGLGVPPNGVGFDDVYILSIPSFTWIKYYPDEPGVGSPHHSLTCNVVDGSQMLVIGGTFPLSQDCDAPAVWGTHNLDLGRQNVANATWYQYLPNITSYVVPPDIIQVIGGNGQGGATLRAPPTWDSRDLAVLFPRKATFTTRTVQAGRTLPSPSSASTLPSSTPTSTPSKSKLSTGALAGIGVGGGIAFLALLTTCVLCLVRRRRRNRTSNSAPPLVSPQMMYNNDPHNPTTPFSPTSTHTANTQRSYPLAPVELAGSDNIYSDTDGHYHHHDGYNGGGRNGTEHNPMHISVEPKYDFNPSNPSLVHYHQGGGQMSPEYELPESRHKRLPSIPGRGNVVNGNVTAFGHGQSPDTARSSPREAWAELSTTNSRTHSRTPSRPTTRGGGNGSPAPEYTNSSAGGSPPLPIQHHIGQHGRDYFH